MADYVTTTEVEEYLEGVLDTEAWDDAVYADKLKAITMATRAIDLLNFQGEKAVATQDNQFPRGDDTAVPQDIKYACSAIVLALLDGVDPQLEFETLRLRDHKYASAKVTYDSDNLPEHIRSGIPSRTAWTYLLPYLRSDGMVEVARSD